MSDETFGSINIIDDVGSTANSYVSVDYVKSRWNLDPNKDYSTLDDEAIAKLAIYTTSIFDSEFWAMYDGYLYNSSYALFWPRTGVTDSRGIAITDYTVFPTDLKNAICEQMYYLNDNNVFAVVNITGLKQRVLEGTGSQTFYDLGELRSALSKDVIGTLAGKMISPLLIGNSYSNAYTNTIVRG